MKRLGLFRRRKADITVVLTVFLTIALITFAIFTFITKNKTNIGRVTESRFIENIYLEESRIEVYAYEAVKESMQKAYNEMGKKAEKDNGYDERFESSFANNLKSKFSGLSPSDKNLMGLKRAVDEGKFEADFTSSILSFKIDGLKIEIENAERTIYASRNVDIEFKISLDEMG